MTVDAIQRRLRDGNPTPDDLSWAAHRLRALADWPDTLTPDHQEEIALLTRVLARQQ